MSMAGGWWAGRRIQGGPRSRCWTTRRRERGSVSVEFAILVPGLILVLGLVVAGGRLWFARSSVEEASYSAARAASLARTASEASVDGVAAGRAALSSRGLECSAVSVVVSTAAFSVPVGQPATVTSQISCTVHFGDVLLPGLPGSIILEATGSSALDTYRAR